MTAPKPRLRWYQFSLRSLLVFGLLCAIACSWLAVKMQQAERQRQVVLAIREMGGQVKYDDHFGRIWLRNLLGDDFFSSVVGACLVGPQITDACSERLRSLTHLQLLVLHESQVTDAGLEHLKGLTSLERLELNNARVTDDGVKSLKKALPNCKILWSSTASQ
jgi:hypothetical protein